MGEGREGGGRGKKGKGCRERDERGTKRRQEEVSSTVSSKHAIATTHESAFGSFQEKVLVCYSTRSSLSMSPLRLL